MNKKKNYIAALAWIWGLGVSSAAAVPIAVSIERQPNGSHYVMGRFMIDASAQSAWTTLSDYDALGSFVRTVRESRRVKSDDDKIYVAQTMVGQAGILRKKISLLLEITETPLKKIEFHDVAGKSFQLYNGSWEIAQWDNGLAITYKLYATPNFFAPEFITNGVFKRDVQNLLEGVRDQILRQEAGM